MGLLGGQREQDQVDRKIEGSDCSWVHGRKAVGERGEGLVRCFLEVLSCVGMGKSSARLPLQCLWEIDFLTTEADEG